ncbi:MAG: prepilin peptidase [Alphaproteobacteria bacterium]|nr:prepilin peptidase [Alphaproteobacteria bacterium SS10]
MPELFPIAISLLISAAVVAAAWYDISGFRIPNRLVMLTAGLFPLAVITGVIPMGAVIGHLGVAAAAFLVCFFMFTRTWLGAGDGKLISALMLLFGPTLALPFVIAMAIAGGVLSVVVLLSATRPLPVWLEGVGIDGGFRFGMRRVPYGVAIAAGALAMTIPNILTLLS